MLTHELKTPLSVIRMRLGTAEPTPRMQSHATQAVNDINAIVERCAMASQLDQAGEPPQLESCDVEALWREAIDQQGAGDRVQFRSNLTGNANMVSSEPLLLRTIINNLLDNAIKYAPANSPIDVELSVGLQFNRAGVSMVIRNALTSSDEIDESRVFERYYRAPGAQRNSGSGLGLFIVKNLIERVGGSVRFRSDRQSVTFEVWLAF
jgi:signal transduction histidine kinase